MLFWAPGALFLKIRENCHGNFLGSRAPSFQNDGLQRPPPPLGASLVMGSPSSSSFCPISFQGRRQAILCWSLLPWIRSLKINWWFVSSPYFLNDFRETCHLTRFQIHFELRVTWIVCTKDNKGLFFGHAPPSNTKIIKMLFLNYFHSVSGKFPYQNKCTKMPQEVWQLILPAQGIARFCSQPRSKGLLSYCDVSVPIWQKALGTRLDYS